MDASIRLHFRRQGERTNHNDFFDGEGNPIVPLSPPHDSFECHDQNQMPIIFAELVENLEDEDERPPPATAPPEPETTQNQSPEANSNTVLCPPNQSTSITNTNMNEIPSKRKRGCKPQKNKNRFKTDISVSRFIVTRTSLPYTIEYNETTLEWAALINTDQEALDTNDSDMIEQGVVTMVFKSIDEARAACHAYAPPRMHSFEDSPKCQICKKGFNKILRRPSHCKNCGICVCSRCTVNWPSSMLPITYNMKSNRRKRFYKVCMACDWLNDTFRQSLLHGDLDKAVALQTTGNVNSRNPFANVRGETYYPVHCAILGGNLAVFKWLTDSLCCPIQSKRRMPLHRIGPIIGNEQIITSKGKSVLDLAMESVQLGILHFLVVEKGVNIMQYKNMNVALRTLELAINHLPKHLTSSDP